MSAGAATFRSILDKPLNQLTEDDISQLTREDCRKYLKQKGMRRPSWNKSQAIQQVICLKALLEPGDDSGSTALRKVGVSPGDDSGSTALRKVGVSPPVALDQGDDDLIPLSAAELNPQSRLEPPLYSSEDATADPENKTSSPRFECVKKKLVEQMSIFYGGKVNVYDGVPPEKAHTIINIAASPIHLPQDDLIDGTTIVWPFPCLFPSTYERDSSFFPCDSISETIQTESQVNRKISLQRYIEKRKDRERLKTKKNVGLTSSLKVYFNNQARVHMSDGNSNRTNSSFPSQSRLPHRAFDRMVRSNIGCLPIDLNIKDFQEF